MALQLGRRGKRFRKRLKKVNRGTRLRAAGQAGRRHVGVSGRACSEQILCIVCVL